LHGLLQERQVFGMKSMAGSIGVRRPPERTTAGLLFSILIATTALLTMGVAGGSAQNPPSLTIALATSQSDILTYIANQQGYFSRQGVSVTTRDNTGAATTSLIVSGQADLAAFAAPAPLAVALQGQNSSIIWAISGGGVGGSMLADGKTVKTLQDLKDLDNCRLGSFPPGTSSYGYAQLYKRKYNSNCTISPSSNQAVQVAALASGAVNATVGGYAYLAPAAKVMDVPFVINTLISRQRANALGPPFTEVVFWGMKNNLDSKRNAVVRYLRALALAQDFVLNSPTNRVASVLERVPDFAALPPNDVKNYVVPSFKGFMPLGGRNSYIDRGRWSFALQRYTLFGLPNFDPSASAVSYENRIDMSYYTQAIGTPTEYNAALSVGAQVPKPKAKRGGGGAFRATANPSGKRYTLRWSLSWTSLTGSVRSAFIGKGRKGSAGPTLLRLCSPCTNGQFGNASVSKPVYSALQTSGAYVALTTRKNPSGEIRGQLRRIAS